MWPSCSMNRASPLCPPALLQMFRLPSTPSLLASRDCESYTYIHTHWLNDTSHQKVLSILSLVILEQSSPNYVCLRWLPAREFQNDVAHAAEALSVCEPILSECACFLVKKSWSSAVFSLSRIHLLGCHLLRKSCQWETWLSQSAMLLLLNLFPL